MMTERKAKPQLTDADRHKRFVETAREAEASEDPEAFDKAFETVTAKPVPRDP